MNDCITTTKQSTTKPCAYFLGYTVYNYWWGKHLLYWLTDGICTVTFPTPYPKSSNLLQYDTSNVINEIPKHDNKQHISIKTDTLGHNEM